MNIQGPPGELRMSITIKRAATGEEEQVELVGRATPEQLNELGLTVPQQEGDSDVGNA